MAMVTFSNAISQVSFLLTAMSHHRPPFAPSPVENATQWPRFSPAYPPLYPRFPIDNMPQYGHSEIRNPYTNPSEFDASFFSPAMALQHTLSPTQSPRLPYVHQTPRLPAQLQSPHQTLSPTPVLPLLHLPAQSPIHIQHAKSPPPMFTHTPAPELPSPGSGGCIDRLSFAPQAPEALTQAERHPDLPTQPPAHPRGKNKLTEQQKNARNFASDARRKQSEALSEAVFAFLQEQEAKIEELAISHNVKVDHVRAKIQHLSKLRSMDRPSLFQATVHRLGEDLNAGK